MVMGKVCSKCGIEKDFSEFHCDKTRKLGIRPECRKCRNYWAKLWRTKNKEKLRNYRKQWIIKKYGSFYFYSKRSSNFLEWKKKYYVIHKEQIKEYRKSYYLRNRDKLLEQYKQYARENREKMRNYSKRWYRLNRERYLSLKKIYRDKNKEKIRQQRRDYYRRVLKDKYRQIRYRLDRNMSQNIWQVLKKKKNYRKWQDLVGYTVEDLMKHLESKFASEMSWDNYGIYWEIDHIIPRSHFKYTSPEDEEFKKCWSLDNLQPLEKVKNRLKGNKLNDL
jgi:hypothetical protein